MRAISWRQYRTAAAHEVRAACLDQLDEELRQGQRLAPDGVHLHAVPGVESDVQRDQAEDLRPGHMTPMHRSAGTRHWRRVRNIFRDYVVIFVGAGASWQRKSLSAFGGDSRAADESGDTRRGCILRVEIEGAGVAQPAGERRARGLLQRRRLHPQKHFAKISL